MIWLSACSSSNDDLDDFRSSGGLLKWAVNPQNHLYNHKVKHTHALSKISYLPVQLYTWHSLLQVFTADSSEICLLSIYSTIYVKYILSVKQTYQIHFGSLMWVWIPE